MLSGGGISWNGQADAVERFIRGYDNEVRSHVEAATKQALEEHGTKTQTYITDLVNGILDKLNKKLPRGTKIEVPKADTVALNWEQFYIPIDYPNLPLQEAVNFVSTMVMSQASKARFARGVATVGGRTHLGIITKANGFEALNEPEIVHKFTGLSGDA